MGGEEEFTDYLLKIDGFDAYKLNQFETFITSMSGTLEVLSKLKRIKAVYTESDKMRFRLLYCALCGYADKNDDLMDAILETFKFDKAEILKLLKFNYPKPEKVVNKKWKLVKFDKLDIIKAATSAKWANVERVKMIYDLVGEEVFIEHMLMDDGDYMNGIENVIKNMTIYMIDKTDILKFIFSFDVISKEYKTNIKLQWRCIYWLSEVRRTGFKSSSSYLFKEMNLDPTDEDKLRELQKFKYPKPVTNVDDIDEKSQYWTQAIG